jgi:hypothetical protein
MRKRLARYFLRLNPSFEIWHEWCLAKGHMPIMVLMLVSTEVFAGGMLSDVRLLFV